jgi:hypothetical protein
VPYLDAAEPNVAIVEPALSDEAQDPEISAHPLDDGSLDDEEPPSSSYRSEDDPVEIPTTGLPPALVGFMVLGAMLVAAVTGFFLLR